MLFIELFGSIVEVNLVFAFLFLCIFIEVLSNFRYSGSKVVINV